MSHARTAIRFFSTVHSSVATLRSQPFNPIRAAFTPEHFPKTLGVTMLSGFVAGWKFMDSLAEMDEKDREDRVRDVVGRKLTIRAVQRTRTVSSTVGMVDV